MKSEKRKVLLLRGWFSSGSTKSLYLHQLGFKVFTPRLSDFSFQRAVEEANEAYEFVQPDLILGMSRGGAVALNIKNQNTPTILLAPAWRSFGRVSEITNPKTIVIHSPKDTMVSYEDSVDLIKSSQHGHLITAGHDHRLNDRDAREALEEAITQFLPLPTARVIHLQAHSLPQENFFEGLY